MSQPSWWNASRPWISGRRAWCAACGCRTSPSRARAARKSAPATTVTPALLELRDWLICQGVTRVVMEATSAYWKPPFYLLEDDIECWVVNARDVKNVPGRPKTDKIDSVWLCKLAERGMLRPSFIPARPQRQLRDLTRYRRTLIQERTREKQRAEKLLEDAQVKLSSGDLRHLRRLRAGHAGRAHRRAARPPRTRGPGPQEHARHDRASCGRRSPGTSPITTRSCWA